MLDTYCSPLMKTRFFSMAVIYIADRSVLGSSSISTSTVGSVGARKLTAQTRNAGD